MAASKHKRGDTFDRSGTLLVTQNGVPLTDLTGWTGRCQMRGVVRGQVIVQFAFQWLNAAQCLARITAPNGTADWPVGEGKIDIQLTSPAGVIVSTASTVVEVVQSMSNA